ncbi:MAG TPA: diaminopimelate decarboxylase [Thermoanaerobaculia bacterium]
MTGFQREKEELCCDGVSLLRIAREVGTPFYVYSRALIEESFRRFDAAFAGSPHLVCYAMKANGNLAIVKALGALGAGVDVVSGGELRAAMEAGITADRIVFSGVGKTDKEIQLGAELGILAFNVESERELAKIDEIAGMLGRTARVALRVNPDIDSGSHPYIATGLKHNKFGIDVATARRLAEQAGRLSHVRLTGLQAHIGSQILEPSPLAETASSLAALANELIAAGLPLETLDLGGGVGVGETEEKSLSPEAYAAAVRVPLAGLSQPLRILIEPGRSIVARAGALVARVLYLKESLGKHFVVTDAAMNDLLRPALYAASHPIEPVVPRGAPFVADIVGPVCETGDFFVRDGAIQRPDEGDLLAIKNAGAYGFAMSSNYNFRPRAAEVLVESGSFRVVRRRETYDDLVRLERE